MWLTLGPAHAGYVDPAKGFAARNARSDPGADRTGRHSNHDVWEALVVIIRNHAGSSHRAMLRHAIAATITQLGNIPGCINAPAQPAGT
jgi:hypothetical protein